MVEGPSKVPTRELSLKIPSMEHPATSALSSSMTSFFDARAPRRALEAGCNEGLSASGSGGHSFGPAGQREILVDYSCCKLP